MNTWLHSNMDIPIEDFLDNESTLRLLSDLKCGLLYWMQNEQPMWHYCRFVFEAGHLHLYARERLNIHNRQATFMIQTTDSKPDGYEHDLAIVCKGSMTNSSISNEDILSYDNHSLFIGTLSCRHIAAFWLTAL